MNITIGATTYSFAELGWRYRGRTGAGVAPLANNLLPISSGDGALFRGTKTPARTTTITVEIQQSTLEQEQAAVAQLVSDLANNDLALEYEGKTLPVVYGGGLEGALAGEDVDLGLERAVLTLAAYQPYWLGSEESAVLANGSNSVSNIGSANTYPLITLDGTGAFTSITNITLGATISFVGLTMPGYAVTIDLEPTGPYVLSPFNDNLDAASTLAGWRLQPGVNLIEIVADAGVTIDMIWVPRYWSVD